MRMKLDIKDYPKWAKATAGVSVLSRSGGLGKQVEMRMGMFGIEVKSIFEYTYSNPGGGAQMEWKSIAGTIKVRMRQSLRHPTMEDKDANEEEEKQADGGVCCAGALWVLHIHSRRRRHKSHLQTACGAR